MTDRISIHICNKDRGSELGFLLRSLWHQTFKDWDVIILDDASGTSPMHIKFIQDIVQRLKIEGHGLKFLRNDISYGVCKARNRLLQDDPWANNTNFVCRLDDDVELEPDFLERLMKLIKKESAGIVSGITPLLSGPDFKRENRFTNSVINMIKLSEDGEIQIYKDDCGFLYLSDTQNVAHQFRSNALIKRELIEKGLMYELGLTNVSFREEAFFSLKALLMGYNIYVDLGAIAWHNQCLSGGCRFSSYAQLVSLDDNTFKRWVKNNKDDLKKVLK